ncbi:MAG: T9SS type A sorting domain-containing protein [Bacteroidota bacterium]
MKKRLLIFSIICTGLYITLTSSSNGYSSNKTGSTGGAVGCGSCHGSSNTNTLTIAFELDSAGTPVTSYKAGMSYTLKMIGTNTGTFTCPYFGFEMSTVNATNGQAGTFTGIASPYRTRTSGSITYAEQSSPINASSGSGGNGTIYTATTSWTAPAAGTGTVRVFGVINAVNGTGGTSGDYWNNASASFTEEVISASVENMTTSTPIIFPNPVVSDLHINTQTACQISILDMNGKLIESFNSEGSAIVNTATWSRGIYQVITLQDEIRTSNLVVKQ